MPTALRDYQHELMTEDESISLLFGTDDTGYLTTTHPSIGAATGVLGDQNRFQEDGVAFGEDFEGPKTVTFEIGVLTDKDPSPHVAGADAMAVFEGVWRRRVFRKDSTAYAVLRSQMVPGRTRRAYGRPRKYSENTGRLTRKGYTPILATFQVSDGRWYDEAEQSVTTPIVPPPDGGFTTPLVTPLTTTAPTVTPAAMTVGGESATWPVVTFYGPVTDPSVDFGPFKIGLRTTIAQGDSITVDTRPWARTVLRNDGAAMGGPLTWETPPLRLCALEPGDYALDYTGTDNTGTSYVEVKWRTAHPRW